MIRIFLLLVAVSFSAHAYVPTVESVFRHGSNPDLAANGVSVTLVVKKIEAGNKTTNESDVGLVADTRQEDFYKIFYTKLGAEGMKFSQTRYANNTFTEASLLEKTYYPNFSAFTIKPTPEEAEKGLFQAMLRSTIFNDGAFLVQYLKALGVPVKLNNEIINREKVELLASYKQYLVAINKDRSARKSESNPLRPDDAAARERAEAIMREPMYVDQKSVQLARDNGQMSWVITAGGFEAVVSYKERDIQKIKFKSTSGEFEMLCKDYWLANGTHSMPRYVLIRDYKGESYQVEVLNLRHYLEKESDLISRLKKWDLLLKGKASTEPKPSFML